MIRVPPKVWSRPDVFTSDPPRPFQPSTPLPKPSKTYSVSHQPRGQEQILRKIKDSVTTAYQPEGFHSFLG